MKQITLCAAFALASLSGAAQGYNIDTIAFGDCYYIIEPDGTLLEFGSGQSTYIYTETVHMGGIDAGGALHLSAQTYKQGRVNFTPGPVSTDPMTMFHYGRSWTVTRGMVDSVSQGLYTTLPEAVENWPAHGRTQFGEAYYLAPFIDADNNGYYNPRGGDVPFIKGDITTLTLFNDYSGSDTSVANRLKVDGYMMFYMYDLPGIAGKTLYRNTVLTNRSTNHYSNTYLSLFNDADAGSPQDDLVGTDIERHAVYAYNSSALDPYTVPKVPYCGTVLLEGPQADAGDGVDNDWDGCVDGFSTSSGCTPENPSTGEVERLTLTNSMYYNNTSSPISGNSSLGDIGIYTYMQSLWLTGDSLRAETPSGLLNNLNGDGYDASGTSQAVRYAFPGNSHSPDQRWAPMQDVNWFDSPANREDRRLLASMGPFTWEAGETVNFTTASFYGNVDSSNFAGILDSLAADIDSIGQLTASNPLSTPTEEALEEVVLELRQSNGNLTILNPHPTSYQLEVLNLNGQVLMQSHVGPQTEAFIHCSHLPAGVYIIRTANSEWVKKWVR